RRRHTRCYRDWSSDVCSSDLVPVNAVTTCPPAPKAASIAPLTPSRSVTNRVCMGVEADPGGMPTTTALLSDPTAMAAGGTVMVRSEERRVGKVVVAGGVGGAG